MRDRLAPSIRSRHAQADIVIMNTKDLSRYKERLLNLRARLRGDVDRMSAPIFDGPSAQAASDVPLAPTHMADVGTDNFEREFTLRLMETKDQTQDEIEKALQRIEDRVYGDCEECGRQIPKVRLNAIPYASLCMKCAAQIELD